MAPVSTKQDAEANLQIVRDITSLVGVQADGEWFDAYFQRTDENRIVLVHHSEVVTYRPGQNVKVRLGDTNTESGVIMAGYIQSVSRRPKCALIDVILKEEVVVKARSTPSQDVRGSRRINCVRKGELHHCTTGASGSATLLNYSANGVCIKSSISAGPDVRIRFEDTQGNIEPILATVRWEVPIDKNFLLGCQIADDGQQ
ncbi:MAG: PilZ domain-containing protein [Planctomyces sp.]|nr:PilZ domain-containing protein [Planctomyces sp.]